LAQRLTPHEYAARVILPLARGGVAVILYGRGHGQHRIARLLGTSQPAVHRYLSRPLQAYLEALEAEGVPQGTARAVLESAAQSIAAGDAGALAEAVNILTLRSYYCRRVEGWCERVFCPGEPVRLYKAVLEALLAVPGLHRLIPEVGSNLAYAPPEAKSIDDVIGLEGRLVKGASGRVYPVGDPVPGGSRHVGLKALEAAGGREAWAIALRGSHDILEAVKRVAPDLIVGVEEGDGVEPVLYLASDDPWKLLETVRTVAENLEE